MAAIFALGVLLAAGVAWGVRHWHFANSYPNLSSGSNVFWTAGDAHWRVDLKSGKGRTRYEITSIHALPDPYTGTLRDYLRLLPEADYPPPETRPVPLHRPPSWVRLPHSDRSERQWITTGYGWPLPAMAEEISLDGADHRLWIWSPGVPGEGVRRRRPVRSPHEFGFPTRPIWSGLMVNGALFASPLWLGMWLIGFARVSLRRRKGKCERCGYSLAGLPPGSACPECGEQLE